MIDTERMRALWYIYVEHSNNRVVRRIGGWCYTLRRRLAGARSVKTGWLDKTSGTYNARGVRVEFCGACPVQGEGTVDGRACYYRSRGEGWQFHVAKPGADDALEFEEWVYSERPYLFPDGGWVTADVSRACIAKAVELFREAYKS